MQVRKRQREKGSNNEEQQKLSVVWVFPQGAVLVGTIQNHSWIMAGFSRL